MAEAERRVDPELESLLQELGNRPRSLFLRTSRVDAQRILRSSTTEPVSAFGVSDALERELVTVHRTELAELLRQACRTKLLEGSRERLFIMHYRTATQRAEYRPMEQIRERARQVGGMGVSDPWVGAVLAVERALSAAGGAGASVHDLAALGQRLEARDCWRMMSAMEYLVDRQHGSACDLAKRVLEGWPTVDEALRAYEILALTEAIDGDPLKALEYQERACTLLEDYPQGQMNRFRYAMLAGDEGTAMGSSGVLDTLLTHDHPMISTALHVNAVRRRHGEWNPPELSIRTARRIEPKLGHVARRLVGVFL